MTRLELIMSDPKDLTVDDARALLSDHVEGSLDAATHARVDAMLAADATLQQERAALVRTLEALRALPRPDAPPDMVAKVRGRLTAERRAGLASEGVSPANAAGGEAVVRGRFRFGGVEAAMGLAAAASVALFIAVVGLPQRTGAPGDDTLAAGLSDARGAVEAVLVAPGFPRDVIVELATQAGMDTLTPDAIEGEGRAAARFVLLLKSEAVARGVEVSGMVPEAPRVRLTIKTAR